MPIACYVALVQAIVDYLDMCHYPAVSEGDCTLLVGVVTLLLLLHTIVVGRHTGHKTTQSVRPGKVAGFDTKSRISPI
jgi:hypothetical protein